MTWEELHDLLTELGDQFESKARVNHQYGISTVALHFVPVAWFISMKPQGDLTIGVYEGEEKRLRGTEIIPLSELTPEFVRERVGNAAREWLVQAMDFDVVREMMQNLSLEKLSHHPLRDMEGVSEGKQ